MSTLNTEQRPRSSITLQEPLNKVRAYFADVPCAQARTQMFRIHEMVAGGGSLRMTITPSSAVTETDQHFNVDIVENDHSAQHRSQYPALL